MTKETILDEALQLLVRSGVRRFRLAELAERLGVVKSALYHHFPGGKQEVLAALFQREEEKVLQAMEGAVQQEGTCRQRLLRLVQAKLRAISVLAQLYQVPEGVVNEVADFCRSRRVGFSQRERQLLFKLLQEGVARGEVRDVNLPLLAAGLQAALLEVSEHVLREKGLDLDSLTELMVDVIFHGIGGAPCGKS
jgi:AcrR family transcriptional regulator